MTKQTVQYTGDIPFHIRPIGTFVDIVKRSGCTVTVAKKDLIVKGNKAMQLLKLEIVKNDHVTIEVSGPDEEQVLNKLVKVLTGGE